MYMAIHYLYNIYIYRLRKLSGLMALVGFVSRLSSVSSVSSLVGFVSRVSSLV